MQRGYRQKGKYRQPWEVYGSVLCVTHKATLSLKHKLFLILEIKCILLHGAYRQPIITKMCMGSDVTVHLGLVLSNLIKVIVIKLPWALVS